jgi:hypothetical protein
VHAAADQAGWQVNKVKDPGSEDRKAKFVTPILNRLLETKVIKDTLMVSFDLCKIGLIVNGVKQPAGVAGPLQAQYIQNPRNRIIYSKTHNGHETITVR